MDSKISNGISGSTITETRTPDRTMPFSALDTFVLVTSSTGSRTTTTRCAIQGFGANGLCSFGGCGELRAKGGAGGGQKSPKSHLVALLGQQHL